MDHFHTMTLQSKMSSYDYYKTLEKLTDNTGLGVRYVSVDTHWLRILVAN